MEGLTQTLHALVSWTMLNRGGKCFPRDELEQKQQSWMQGFEKQVSPLAVWSMKFFVRNKYENQFLQKIERYWY